MTFSLKKTLSRIQTRRRSADTVQLQSSSTSPPRLSMTLLPSPTEPNVSLSRPALSDLFSSSLTPPNSSSSSTVTPPDSGIAILKARVSALEAENTELRAKIESLTLDAQIREEELSKFRSEYYTELSETIVRRREATATQERLDQKLARTQHFISSIVEAGLHDPVLSEAWHAVKAGRSADDALVDSIKKAASRPGTSWSTIVPAITGPRTPEHYLSAINLTLKTRRELKKATQVGLFWKKTAKRNPAHKNTFTPSSSNLSDLSSKTVDTNEQRQTAVDDLLAKLKADDPPVCTTTKDSSSSLLKTPSHVPTESISVPTSSSLSSAPTSISVSIDMSMNSLSSNGIPCPFLHHSYLAALSSQNLATTGQGSHSAAPVKHCRPVLRSIDLNCDSTSRTTPIAAPAIYIPKQSTRSLDKQKAVLPAVDNFESEGTSEATPALGPSHPKSPPLADSAMIAAEKALLSLERICAGFSSGSLGSLGTIARSSSDHLKAFSSTFSAIPSVSARLSTTSSKLPVSTMMPSTRSQVSSLPVLKHRHLESSPETHTPSIKVNHDRGIPAAIHDPLDDLKSEGLHTRHGICVDGSSLAAPDDVPSRTNKIPPDVSSSAPMASSTYKPTIPVTRSTAGPRSTILTSSPSQRARARALAPLASHVLRCEVAQRSNKLHPRRVFGARIDHDHKMPRMSANKENRNPPVKTVRKRKGMIFVEHMQPVAASASNKDDEHASTSASHSHRKDNNIQVSGSLAQHPNVSPSIPSSTPVVKARRRSLIPVFMPRSPISPPKKYSLPQNNASSPSRIPASALRSTVTPTKRSMPSPLRATKNGSRAA